MNHGSRLMKSKVSLQSEEEVKKCRLKLYASFTKFHRERAEEGENLKGAFRDRNEGRKEGQR